MIHTVGLSTGSGDCQRLYQWALIEIRARTAGRLPGQDGGQHHLLIRRNRTTGELAFYRTWSPHPVPMATLVRVAGTRRNVEEGFQTGKELTALDEHQVRSWTSWQRWTVLAMLAHAFLTVITAQQRPPASAAAGSQPPDGPLPTLIPLTRNEIRHLLTQLTGRVQRTAAFSCTGRSGDDTDKPTPAPPTTDAEPQPNDHDLRLQY